MAPRGARDACRRPGQRDGGRGGTTREEEGLLIIAATLRAAFRSFPPGAGSEGYHGGRRPRFVEPAVEKAAVAVEPVP
jgi:hypothetical protein